MLRVKQTTRPAVSDQLALVSTAVSIERLSAEQEFEVLEFLARRPLHNVAMMSLIRDNGLISALNRGTFYGCRDANRQLEGVALIGHATLLETVSDRALKAFARVVRECPDIHLIMGEQERIQNLWDHCASAGHHMRRACRELLFEVRWPVEVHDTTPQLQLATANELELIMPVQANMAFEESGVNPLEVDPIGFRRRCLRRIEQGRTWVVIENGSLVFKADIIAETSEVIYLEGVWLSEEARNQDHGVSLVSELSRMLLKRSHSVCLLVNERNKRAQAFYKKCGYLFRATYETIFLPQKESVFLKPKT
jgi:ribosomal protein S18 acetylase RimI-like enzyme